MTALIWQIGYKKARRFRVCIGPRRYRITAWANVDAGRVDTAEIFIGTLGNAEAHGATMLATLIKGRAVLDGGYVVKVAPPPA